MTDTGAQCNQCSICHLTGCCPSCNQLGLDPHEDPTFLHSPDDVEPASLTEPELRMVKFHGIDATGEPLYIETP